MVNMMSSDYRCFVYGKNGYIDSHCPSAQCYNCDGFGHFAQDFPEKIPPSGTPCHHDIDHTPPHIIITTAGTGHTPSITDVAKGITLTGQDHTHQLQHDRSASNYQRHAFCSLLHQHSSLQYPSTDRHSRRHCHRDTLHQHRCNLSMTQHSSCWNHSHNYSTDCSWSSSRHSSDTTYRLHVWKTSKPHSQIATPIDPSIKRRSLFRTHNWTLPQNEMIIWML